MIHCLVKVDAQSANPRRISSYRIPASNPFGICSYKTLDLKSFRICSYEKRGICPLVLVPAKLPQLSPRVMGRSATYAKVENTQMRARRIKVTASSGAYEVVCAAGAVSRLGEEISRLGKFTSVHVVSSPKVAEMAKLAENTYRAVNIAYVNELAMLAHEMDVDIWEVMRAAATKPFGYQSFLPGIGPGGQCIPVNPYYISWKAREFDFHTSFIELAGDINLRMTNYVMHRVHSFASRLGISLVSAKVLCFEMESSILFTLGRLFGLKTAALFGVVANRVTNEFGVDAGVEDAIAVAIEGIRRLPKYLEPEDLS